MDIKPKLGMRVKWTAANPDHGTIVGVETNKFWVQWDHRDPDTDENDPIDYSGFHEWSALKPL